MSEVNEADDQRSESNVNWEATTDDSLDRRYRGTYDKAKDAFERKNYEYAISLFRGILKKHPAILDIRSQLRSSQWMKQGRKASVVRQVLSTLILLPTSGKVKAQISGDKPAAALDTAEQMMSRDCTASVCINMLATAAEYAELPETVANTLEWGLKHHPKDQRMMVWLANTYIVLEQSSKAVEVCQKLVAVAPNNQKYKDLLKDAGAIATMEDGGWTNLEKAKESDQDASFRDVIKDKTAAARLEQAGRTVRNEQGTEALIEQALENLAAQDSVDNRRKLADLYAEAGRLDDAIKEYETASEMAGTMDPATDRAVTKLRLKKFDMAIEKSDDEAEKERLATERDEMHLAALHERVRRFPNAHEDRLVLAELLFDTGQVDEALQHFQQAARNPRHRLQADIFIGRCFLEKGQADLAVDKLKTAVDNLRAMDSNRKNALYHLGFALRARGDEAEAMQAFKTIYQADVNYRDVRELVEGG